MIYFAFLKWVRGGRVAACEQTIGMHFGAFYHHGQHGVAGPLAFVVIVRKLENGAAAAFTLLLKIHAAQHKALMMCFWHSGYSSFVEGNWREVFRLCCGGGSQEEHRRAAPVMEE